MRRTKQAAFRPASDVIAPYRWEICKLSRETGNLSRHPDAAADAVDGLRPPGAGAFSCGGTCSAAGWIVPFDALGNAPFDLARIYEAAGPKRALHHRPKHPF